MSDRCHTCGLENPGPEHRQNEPLLCSDKPKQRAKDDLRSHLVGLGLGLGTRRYVGQHPTEAAHEFADHLLPVIDAIEDRIVARLTREER